MSVPGVRRRTFANPAATSSGISQSQTTAPTSAPPIPPLSSSSNRQSSASPAAKASGNSLSADPSSPTTSTPTATKSQANSINYEEFDGTVAATFLSSKGTELLNFARRKVEEHDVRTAVVESDDGKYNVLLMSIPYHRMLPVAEELGLRKRDLDGFIRTFRVEDVDLFTTNGEPDALFSQSEQILLLEFWLASIKPDKINFDDVVGNESILEWCKRQNYVEDTFPLHHRASATAIMQDISFRSPLLDIGSLSKVQNYFGDKVALYFTFLCFYTKALITYGIAGLLLSAIIFFIPTTKPLLLFFYSIFATLWGAAFISLWKRRNVETVYMWTSLIMGDSADESLMSMSKKEDLRRKFFGVEVSHRITGERITIFPKRERIPRVVISIVVVLTSLVVSCKLMLLALDLEDIMSVWIKEKADLYKWSSSFIMKQFILPTVPTVVYVGCLNLLDLLYGILARRLTENENHKYTSDYENSLVFKLVLFQFLNMNMAYLYVAFVRRDYERLSSSIRSVLVVELVVGNIKETVLPMIMSKRKQKARLAEAKKKKREQNPDLDEHECTVSVSDINPITMQLDMEPYDGVFDDYFELVRQFSQISLFAAAFPFGAALALANNLIEVYTDLYKLVYRSRRASPQRAINIGAWIRAFEFISIISIMTNLGIITVTAQYSDKVVGKGISKSEEYFWMVVIEHILIVTRFAFATLFEGIPSWVRDQRAKEMFAASKKSSDTSPTSATSNVNDQEDMSRTNANGPPTATS